MVLASPGFFALDYSQVTPVFERALHANIAINTLDVRGLWMDAMSDAQNPVRSTGSPTLPYSITTCTTAAVASE